MFTTGAFLVGALLTLGGFTVLGGVLRQTGDRFLSQLGLVSFLFGTMSWAIHLAFRATVMASLARETSASAAVPAWYGPLRLWSGAMYAIYMPLAYLAIAAFGAAMLKTGWAGKGWGRTFVVFGVVAALGFVARLGIFDLPLGVQFMPYAMGMILMRRAAAKHAPTLAAKA